MNEKTSVFLKLFVRFTSVLKKFNVPNLNLWKQKSKLQKMSNRSYFNSERTRETNYEFSSARSGSSVGNNWICSSSHINPSSNGEHFISNLNAAENLIWRNPITFWCPLQSNYEYYNRSYTERNSTTGVRDQGAFSQTSNICTAGSIHIPNIRKWKKVNENVSNNGYIFTLMSYNVLAQGLLENHSHLYKYHDRRFLDWNVRWKNILKKIEANKPTIICLQEVQESHLTTHFLKLNDMDYKCIYKKRTGPRIDGCAIFYNSKDLSLVEYESVEYYQPNISILDRDNVAIIAKFSPKADPNLQFVVATTHLLYNPKREDVRVAQMQILMTELERIAFRKIEEGIETYFSSIITGDLNSNPNSALYKFISKAALNYKNLSLRRLKKEGPPMGKILIPKDLKITDNCQHAALREERKKGLKLERIDEFKLTGLYHSEKKHDRVDSNQFFHPQSFSTGLLTHNFPLKSVYNHFQGDDIEATTFQEEWNTVDYIFYSGRYIRGKVCEDKLKLLSKYTLPTAKQLDNTYIPNEYLGSDHLALIAEFQLQN